MRHEFRLADIGEGLEEAEIISWLVRVGDLVTRDQPLIEVMTDKSNAELPAPTGGRIVELGGAVGDILAVGQLIAAIDDAAISAAPADRASSAIAADAPTDQQSIRPAIAPDAATKTFIARPKASPTTRRKAAERGIDLSKVVGTGPGGRILLSDLDQPAVLATPGPDPARSAQAAAVQSAVVEVQREDESIDRDARILEVAASPQPGAVTDRQGAVPLRGVRRAVAQNMARSWFDIPHIHAFEHIDAVPLLELRQRLRATERAHYQGLTPLTFFVAAVARALRAHPEANASISMTEETITYHPSVNIGIAVAAPHGLVVPVLRGADDLDFAKLSVALAELVQGARDGSLSRDRFTGGTATITNFGSLGGEQAAPLIRPPESVIVGFGSIKPRPFVIDNAVVARKTMHLVVGADHRLLDGDVTTAFLTDIAETLRDPLRLVL